MGIEQLFCWSSARAGLEWLLQINLNLRWLIALSSSELLTAKESPFFCFPLPLDL